VDVNAYGTRKCFFRFNLTQKELMDLLLAALPPLRKLLHIKRSRRIDPTRAHAPQNYLTGIAMGIPQVCFLIDRVRRVEDVPQGRTLQEESARCRAVEAKEQEAAGGRAHVRRCWACNQPVQAHKCSRCKVARYCNRACQKQDWGRHKRECKNMRVRTGLLDALSVNMGYHVNAKECRGLSDALSPESTVSLLSQLNGPSTPALTAFFDRLQDLAQQAQEPYAKRFLSPANFAKFANAFGAFCTTAADLGGFYVW
jgi:hypothetical protein